MKGQRLFVRPSTASDDAEIEAFFSSQEVPGREVGKSETVEALIGKLVGEMVAYLSFSRAGEAIRIESIFVARLLRRKWIGRFMIEELERIAAASQKVRLEVSADCEAVGFFRAIGFRRPAPDAQTLTRETPIEEVP